MEKDPSGLTLGQLKSLCQNANVRCIRYDTTTGWWTLFVGERYECLAPTAQLVKQLEDLADHNPIQHTEANT